ncbi:uncharacterized protein LOC117219883 isoform X1 [Megalopta genalis]|uniref:uncharacterized protein LOC117219883 isoform X1 n=2 Tax=Megalopta genalis TaxID=115081 RepID=UPI003FD52AE9
MKMLQFNTTICTINTRFAPRLRWRITALFATSSMSSQEPGTAVKQTLKSTENGMNKEQQENFNKLKISVCNSLKADTRIASKIKSSNNIHDLLELIKLPHLSQSEILKTMDSIITWVYENNSNTNNNKSNLIQDNNNKVKLETKTETHNEFMTKYGELSTTSMIEEISKLAKLKKRNLKQLQFLFNNISEYHENFSVAHISTILYSMATLSYIDEPFLDKMSSCLMSRIVKVNSGAVRSILRSMSILKYKNSAFLSHICKLFVETKERSESWYILNIIQSLALLGEQSKEVHMMIQKFKPQVTLDVLGFDDWLSYVWCSVVLNSASNSDVESVLNDQFVTTLFSAAFERNLLQEVKLQNINGAAKYILKDYHGPLLNTAIVNHHILPHSSQKLLYIDVLKQTLEAISPSPKSFTMNVNTKMGFLLDAECYIDSKFNIINPDNTTEQTDKLAILVHDYHSYCHGVVEVHGIIQLYERLLEHSGYKVLPICYKQFGLDDKLIKRETFLKHRIQQLSSV